MLQLCKVVKLFADHTHMLILLMTDYILYQRMVGI